MCPLPLWMNQGWRPEPSSLQEPGAQVPVPAFAPEDQISYFLKTK